MIKIIFNSLLGIALIFIWSRFVNLTEVFQIISKTNLTFVFIIFGLLLLSPTIRALRFKIFLSEVKKVPLKDLIFLNGAAQILNFFIPIRAGEVAKGVYLNQKYGLNLGKAVIWTFIDRFVDFVVVLLLASILVVFVPTNLDPAFIKTSLVIFVIALIGTYLAVFQINFMRKIAKFLPFKKLSSFILDSFSILDRHPKDLLLMLLITISAYVVDGLIWYLTFMSLGAPQEFLRMFLGQILSALTYLIPAAPGYVGSAEASGLLILSGVFGIEANLASAMTVLFHIVTAFFVLVFGLISIFSLKLDLGLILKKALKRS